ncbi:MAG TPA: NAD-dependent epimerase/dehydratase family protein [Anaeromyxobacteraceae bacterium]|nr:NAD-dependent epimerase/dehydratase family protein [Anaeromyxobacteraceae bacterium]
MEARTAVLVTGSSGFVGTRLAGELARRGTSVRALVRAGSDLGGLGDPRIQPVAGDVLEPESLRRAAAGCREVYHLAAHARAWARDPATFCRVNVEGTRHLLEAARRAGVRRVVVASSVVTLGDTPPCTVGDEGSPRSRRPLTEYEASKLEAEREALRASGDGLEVVVVNPTRVYGQGKWTEGNSVSRYIDLYTRGRLPFLLAGGGAVANYAYVEDLVSGFMAAMERGRPGERYILGGENATLRRLLDLVDDASGRRHLRLPLPAGLARGIARLEVFRAHWLGGSPLITPGWLETFLLDGAFSCAKAERELGYRITPLAEGIHRTWQWIERRQEGAHELEP